MALYAPSAPSLGARVHAVSLNLFRFSHPGLRLSVLATALALSACGGEPASQELPAPTVEVIVAKPESLQLDSSLPGRIEPFRVAEVRARVAGIVLRRTFEEGSTVKAGQVLFEIDPAPFRASLSRAQAELAKAQSELDEARRVATRYEPLAKAKAISQQEYESATTRMRSAESARQAAAAAVESARLDLKYATVTAPISGRIGRALVTEGALVGQGEATPLATIQQLDKVYADFQQPVHDVLRLRDALSQGALTEGDGARKVKIQVEGTRHEREGTLLFSDITVDRSTSQVLLRGVFDNPDDLLLPGMFVRVVTPQGTDDKAILVPQRAVQSDGQGGQQVLIVDQKNIVQARAVRTGQMRGTRWQIVEGLAAGDRVVVAGANLAPAGTQVRLKTATVASAPAAAASRG